MHIGGGIGVPLSSTARFAGISGTFQIGAGPNFGKHNSIVGEFMWHGLPPNQTALLPLINPLESASNLSFSNNLYALTANYMFHVDGHRYGFYVIGGGGWYYRHLALNNIHSSSGCHLPTGMWTWWGYVCQGGFVSTSNTIATRGVKFGRSECRRRYYHQFGSRRYQILYGSALSLLAPRRSGFHTNSTGYVRPAVVNRLEMIILPEMWCRVSIM